MIGIKPTLAGQTVGWIDNPGSEKAVTVDFGIYNSARQANRRAVNGLEPVILLDFNVQGDIMNDPRLSKILARK
jgi:hypothetical protein